MSLQLGCGMSCFVFVCFKRITPKGRLYIKTLNCSNNFVTFVNKRFFISLVRNFFLSFFLYIHMLLLMSDYICILACLVGVFWKTSQKKYFPENNKTFFSEYLSLVTAEDIWRYALRNTNTCTLSWRLKWKVGKHLHIYRRYLLLIYLDNIKKQKKNTIIINILYGY